MIRAPCWCLPLVGLAASLALEAGDPAEPRAFPEPVVMRIESELFSDGDDEPVARSLTLFEGGVAWDFLELPAADSPEAAGTYRRFADTAILLKALLHPGGIPPFPRLALNRRLEAAAAIPAEVTLEIDPRLAVVAGGAARLRSVHKTHPRLLAADRRLVADAEAHVAGSEPVELAAFAAPAAEEPAAAGARRE